MGCCIHNITYMKGTFISLKTNYIRVINDVFSKSLLITLTACKFNKGKLLSFYCNINYSYIKCIPEKFGNKTGYKYWNYILRISCSFYHDNNDTNSYSHGTTKKSTTPYIGIYGNIFNMIYITE